MNKLYLATREICDYDEFDGFVVTAESIDEAKELIKSELYGDDYLDEFELKEVDINKKEVLLGSFNAG